MTKRRPKPGISAGRGRPAEDPRHPYNSSWKFMEAIHLLRVLARGATEEELLEATGVSRRTIFRRISALRQANIGVVCDKDGVPGRAVYRLQNQTLATAILADVRK